MSKPRQTSGAQFLKWMGPVLDCLRAVGGQAKPREVSEWIARTLRLPEKITEVALEATGANRFHNQVAWARQYLMWEGLIDGSKYGWWTLTPKGAKTFLNEEASSALFRKWTDFHAEVRGAIEPTKRIRADRC